MAPERDFGATIARDSGLMDARYTVTFTSRTPDGDIARTVEDVLKYAITRDELLRGGGGSGDNLIFGNETIFELPTDEDDWDDTVIAPKEADTITLDGVVYSVKQVFTIAWDTVFQVVCIEEK